MDSAFSVKSNNSWSSSKSLRYSPILFSFHIVVLCFIPKCVSFRLRVFFLCLFGVSLFFPYDFQITKALLIEKIFLNLITFASLSKISWAYLCGSISAFSILFHLSVYLYLWENCTILTIVCI